MGLDYALVHVKYTIPPAVLLTLLYRPLFTRLDVYRICFLITIAVTATIPWDSYLIRTGIWTYPPDAVLGPLLFQIPAEELFFFVIQTYIVSLLYICLGKPLFHPVYLPHLGEDAKSSTWRQRNSRLLGMLGQCFLVWAILQGVAMIQAGDETTYFGLIIAWACPFMLLLWTLSSQFLLRLPAWSVLLPIAIPTLYLWIVDTLALRRGTWVIVPGTKIGIVLWEGLEAEEAFFFLATNIMIVLGMVAFDNAMAIVTAFPSVVDYAGTMPSPWTAIKVLLTPTSTYDTHRILGLKQAITRLERKSRSFYLASSTFEGRARVDLVLLYSFCRTADDLIDGASSAEEANMWIDRLRSFLDLGFLAQRIPAKTYAVREFVVEKFPAEAHMALLQLPLHILSKQPLYDLLKGFELDLMFVQGQGEDRWPIDTEEKLEQYGVYVAGTVAELCINVVLHHYSRVVCGQKLSETLLRAGNRMGVALQIVNIARDIGVDAEMGRVYIPTSWLQGIGTSPDEIHQLSTRAIADMTSGLRSRLLDRAFAIYREARPAIEKLPSEVRGPMRVAIESYMEIGRVLKTETYRVSRGRATVPKLRRLLVAWRALSK